MTGFYPNWGSSLVKCLNATEELPPDYMRKNPEQWLHDDIDGCCEAYYHFDYDNCVEGTGGTLAASSTGKWYVDHQEELCRVSLSACDLRPFLPMLVSHDSA